MSIIFDSKVDSIIWEIFKSGILPVLLFFSGYLLNIYVDNKKEKKRLNKVKLYFMTLVKLEYEMALQQADLYDEFSTRLNNIDNRDYKLLKVYGHPEKSLYDIDHNDLYSIFISHRKITEITNKFNSLLASLKYLDERFQKIEVDSETFVLLLNDLDKTFVKQVKDLSLYLTSIAGTRDITTALNSSDPFTVKIGQVMDFYYVNKNVLSYSSLVDKILKPLITFFNTDSYIDDSRVKQILPKVNELLDLYDARLHYFNERKEINNKVASNLRTSAQELSRIIKEIS